MNTDMRALNEFKPFNEATFDDACVPIRERFGEGACELARLHLKNPVGRLCNDFGTVGYRNGKPVCFQAACIRRLFFGKKEIFGIVGGMTCRSRKGCPPSVTFETIERAEQPRMGSVISFGNTCCKETAMINAAKGGGIGPESCSRLLWTVINPVRGILYMLRRKVLKLSVPVWPRFCTLNSAEFRLRRGGLNISRAMSFDQGFFDILQEEYLKSNEGLYCSRTADELNWIFGGRVRDGSCVILCATNAEGPCGYVILQMEFSRRRCRILDLVAIKNDESILSALLSAAKTYLRRCTPILVLEVIGFPTFVQPLFRRMMSRVQPNGHNRFAWGAFDSSWLERLQPVIDSRKSWFFGPYDGDECFP